MNGMNGMNTMNGQSAMSLGLTSMDGNQLQHVEEDHQIDDEALKEQDEVSPSESDLQALQRMRTLEQGSMSIDYAASGSNGQAQGKKCCCVVM